MLGDRLKKIRSTLSRDKFAEQVGVSKNTIVNYESGERSPDANFLKKITELYPHINPAWLLTGEGSMQLGGKGENEAISEAAAPHGNHAPPKIDNDEFALVPKYEVSADCGSGRTVTSEQIVDFLAFKKKWLNELGLTPKKLALVTAKGDSMEPTIRDGALMLVDMKKCENLGEGIYIIRLGGELIAKRLQRGIDGSVNVRSDNKNYPDMEAKPDQVHLLEIIGRVVWAGQRF